MTDASTSRKAFSYAVAADHLSISIRTLTRRIAKGEIRSISVSNRRKAVPASEIDRILAGGLEAAQPAA